MCVYVVAGMRCMDCGYNCHEKCMQHVPKNCAKLRPVSEASISSASISKTSLAETASVTAGMLYSGNWEDMVVMF